MQTCLRYNLYSVQILHSKFNVIEKEMNVESLTSFWWTNHRMIQSNVSSKKKNEKMRPDFFK